MPVLRYVKHFLSLNLLSHEVTTMHLDGGLESDRTIAIDPSLSKSEASALPEQSSEHECSVFNLPNAILHALEANFRVPIALSPRVYTSHRTVFRFMAECKS